MASFPVAQLRERRGGDRSNENHASRGGGKSPIYSSCTAAALYKYRRKTAGPVRGTNPVAPVLGVPSVSGNRSDLIQHGTFRSSPLLPKSSDDGLSILGRSCSRLCRRRDRNSDRRRLWDNSDNPVHLSQGIDRGVPLVSCVAIPCTSVPLEDKGRMLQLG